MEYKIVTSPHLHFLGDRVNEEIRKGWIPQGGVGKSRIEGSYQPMIKNN